MDKISKVTLHGFKGISTTYQLSPATLLSGVNGSGKSACLQAIVFALTGITPDGKALDRVAQYFPLRGGWVQVEDSAGRWIKRILGRDIAKSKCWVDLETSDDEDEAEEPNLKNWQVSEVVLDVAEFLGLSPEKRREFVLRLCGGGKEAPKDIFAALELEYAREIAGPAATPRCLIAGGDVPPEVTALAHAWMKPRGLSEVLRSYLGNAANAKSLSENCLKLGEVAKENKLGSRKAALDASAALRELEAELKGAQAAAVDLAGRKAAVEAAREEMSTYRGRAERREEAKHRQHAAIQGLDAAQRNLDLDRASAAAHSTAGERPAAPGAHPARENIQAELLECRELAGRIGADIRTSTAAQDQIKLAKEETTRAGEALADCRAWLMAKISGLIDEIPDEADPGIPALREAIWDLAAGWRAELGKLEDQAKRARERLDNSCKLADGTNLDTKGLTKALEQAKAEEHELLKAQLRFDALQGARAADFKANLARWEQADRAHRDARARLEASERALPAAQKQLEEAEKRLAAIETVNGEAFPKMEEIESRLYKAQEAAETAEKAAGAVQAYESASARAEAARVDEKAWSHAEKAVQALRERQVGAATGGLIADLQAILKAAGREETVYLELENDRGRPIFELGWVRDGKRTALPALSSGEAVIFCAALSIALTLRAPGRRLLLVEADPLDTTNLEALLQALAPQADSLEALVVATAAEGWTSPPAWKVVRLNGAKR